MACHEVLDSNPVSVTVGDITVAVAVAGIDSSINEYNNIIIIMYM